MLKIDKMAFFVHANQKYTATHCSRTGYRNAIAPAFGDIVHLQPAALNICQTSVCEIENYWYFLDGH